MCMEHFDRLLELELARLLDPVVNAPAPRRRGPRRAGTLKAVAGGLTVLPSDMVPLAIVAPIGTPVS